ncbi:hypothetical protein [uncultured Draconibacterium sp.]|uniref:hypothetical protein n=1 Tax=uncultured Draconibacterium sp. TaxID=1573823 RepID=UPI002600026F|nr:hypothetical protein [uncultured Draconibacterium sp.]
MRLIALILFITGTTGLWAQENISVKMIDLAIDSSMQSAFVVEIPEASAKKAIKIWEDRLVPKNLLSTFKKVPRMEKTNKDTWQIDGIVIEEICADSLSITTRITPLKGKIVFATLYKTPSGFIGSANTNNDLTERTRKFLRSHAIEVYKDAVAEELDQLEKELKKMNNSYDAYSKDNRKLKRKTDDSESTLELMTNTEKNQTGATTLEELKEIEKERKAQKKYAKKIDNNSAKQKKLSKEIRKKEKEIEAVEEKLKNIR